MDFIAEHAKQDDNKPVYVARPVSPVVKVHRQRMDIRKGKVNQDSLKIEIRNFFWQLASNRCLALKNASKRSLGCYCLLEARNWLEDEDIDALIEYLFEFGLMERKQQRGLLAEWMKYAMAVSVRVYKTRKNEGVPSSRY